MAEPGLAHEAVLVAALRLGAAPLSPPRTEAVPGVPGAFLIRGALSAADVESWIEGKLPAGTPQDILDAASRGR